MSSDVVLNIDEMIRELNEYWIAYLSQLPSDIEHPQIGRDELELCVRHFSLVLQANERVNLTRIVDPHEAVILHLLDSLILLPFVEQAPSGALLDIGTGAGFPGLTLAIASRRRTVLMDSVGKKVAAVQSFIDALSIPKVSAVHDRAESYAVDRRGAFSVVVARAVAPLPVLIEYASPFLHHGGLLVVTKGTPSNEERISGAAAAAVTGFSTPFRYDVALPCDMGNRSIFVYEKSSKPSLKLPRPVGLAKKHPLGMGVAF